MAREVRRLTARAVAGALKPGRHADGDGLYLVVDRAGARRWVFLFRRQGTLREMGLGSAGAVTLAQAREAASTARKLVTAGKDPIAERRANRAHAAARPTFGAFAEALVAELEHGFRNAKHKAQWRSTLATYASPLRDAYLDQITTDDVVRILKPIWTTKHETASRVRGRIERVLDAARARGLRAGDNPARWRGHLEALLPRATALSRGHHAAMPYAEVPAFMSALRAMDSLSALALQFTILTAARTSEALEAEWPEIALNDGVWTIPAARMKAGRSHRSPLSPPALAILTALAAERRSERFVFPGHRPNRPLSNMAMSMVLRRMGRADITVHGFRSSFRDWCAEETDHPREIAEAALAHVVGDQTERAYRRGDALEKRRALMIAWGEFCLGAAWSVPRHAAV